MKYHPPATVLSPRDCIGNVKVLYDGGYKKNIYSLAIVTWQGKKRIGIRWNINQREWDNPDKRAGKTVCIGEPNSRGYPTWFILPPHLLRLLLAGQNEIAGIVEQALAEVEDD